MNKKVIKPLFLLSFAFCLAFLPPLATFANDDILSTEESDVLESCTESAINIWSNSKLRRYAEDNILYYDDQFEDSCKQELDEEDCLSTYDLNPVNSDDLPTSISGNYARLKQAVRDYHETAMQAQKEYGTPWEMVFAQMQKESQVGTVGIAIKGATNNWLGITKYGDAGTWISPKGRKWAKFSSVNASITAWAGSKVLRNPKGYYNSTFKYLSLDNYDLNAFIRAVIEIYAPKEDGNDPVAYANQVIGLINGPIKEVREELGLPSSEEWARENNIDAASMTGFSSSDPNTSNGENFSVNCNHHIELKPGGFTVEEAENFMADYIAEASKGLVKEVYEFQGGYAIDADCTYGTLKNCSAFSEWFASKFWGVDVRHKPHSGCYFQGSQFVNTLTSCYGLNYNGKEPVVYSIFSHGPFTNKADGWSNHTGVVLGIDTEHDLIIIGEASCTYGYVRVKTDSLSKWTNNPSKYGPTYAYKEGFSL